MSAEGSHGEEATFSPTAEFEHAVEPLSFAGVKLQFHLGPIDMSINRVVVYLWLAAIITGVICIGIARIAAIIPSRKQVAFEALYEMVRDNLVGAVMHGKVAVKWFPYLLSLFLFILISNLIGLVPLFVSVDHNNIPQFSAYAATSNINVTVALALLTFGLTHVSGVRANGAIGYFKGWIPGTAPVVLKPVLFLIHAVSEFFRLVSLGVRLFANMLAGHIMILVFYGLIFMLPSVLMIIVLSPLIEVGVVAISLFEIFVSVIQAYIFAILSAVYIGGAIHQEH
ncbi:MAG: F0F1 ATP synthase subunit A [Thermoleophilia bacterium]|nr:F0F1 ATP synthase subunit A [Thermoleophilia bacterium]